MLWQTLKPKRVSSKLSSQGTDNVGHMIGWKVGLADVAGDVVDAKHEFKEESSIR